jgi:hypothetical protein
MTDTTQMNRQQVEAAFVDAAERGDYRLKKALWVRVWELTELGQWDSDKSYQPELSK